MSRNHRCRSAHGLQHLLAIAALLVSMSLGCSEDNEELPYAPLDCERTRPQSGEIEVLVTINGENPTVDITFYKGVFEDNIVVLEATTASPVDRFSLPIDDYAVTASYSVGGSTVIVLNATSIGTTSEEYRNAKCWEVENGSADLRLDP